MGEALLRCFPWVDYIFSGEADFSFPEFVKRISRAESIEDIGGILYRNGHEVKTTGPAEMVTNMDALPLPDFRDYFAQLENTSVRHEIPVLIQFETARGCW